MRGTPHRLAALGFLVAACLSATARGADTPPGTSPFRLEGIPAAGGPRRDLAAYEREGIVYVAVPDLAQLLGIDYAWWSDLGKLTLFFGRQAVWVLEGSEIAALDGGRLVQLPGAVFLWNGRLHVPLELIVDESGFGRPWVEQPVTWMRHERLLAAAPFRRVEIKDLDVLPDPAGWRLMVRAADRLTWRVERDDHAAVVVLIEGATHDPFLVPVPGEHPWFQGLRLRRLGDDLELSFAPTTGAQGYRIDERDGGRALEILLGFDERDLREGRLHPFSGGAAGAPDAVERVVLDPGHGADSGRRAEEAAAALEIADLARKEIEARLGLRVVLTREGTGGPTSSERADFANREEGDLLVSIHLHERSGGVVAFVASPESGTDVPPTLAELGFRSARLAQEPFHADSRLLARCLLEGLRAADPSLRGGILEEGLVELRGAAMPAVLLEIPMSGRPDDGAVRALAAGLVEGVRLYVLSGAEY